MTLTFFPIESIGNVIVCNRDKTRYQRSACKRARLMTSQINIYFCQRPLQNSPWKMLQQCLISFLYHVRVEIISLYRDLSLINAWCCRTDANINSRSRRELILRNLTFQQHALITVKKKYFLNNITGQNLYNLRKKNYLHAKIAVSA